jgi:xanthine dehydrogenase small subunit
VTVNGRTRPLDGVRVHTSALDFLRDLGLTGVKEGCAEGECGACSVLVNRPAGEASQWTAVNSCLIPAASLDGQEVVTAEGLGSPGDLHPCQQGMADLGGSQCGYCTPGFVCSMAAEYYRADRAPGTPSPEHGENGFDLHALSGNLCRCTGYRPIKDAAFGLGTPGTDDPLAQRIAEPAPEPATTLLDSDTGTFVRPATLDETLDLLGRHEDAVLVAGSTDLGVEVNLRGLRPPLVVAIDRLPELREITVAGDAITLGAALTLSEIERAIGGQVPLLDAVWPQFASRLIRNGATLGGNLGTASPIGDTPPALLALEAALVLAGPDGERTVALADYFTGYRQSVRAKTELIKAVRVPLPLSDVTAFHKIAKRRFDDISSVAVGFALDVVDGEVRKARIGLGGVAATPIRALATEAALEGRPWSADTIEAAAQVLAAEGTPIDDQRASAAYRSAMLGNSLRKLYDGRSLR